MKTKFFSLLFAIVASTGMLYADIYSGTCGNNLTWSLNTADKTLSISGTGEMSNYERYYYNYSYRSSTPWWNYRDFVWFVSLSKGVTTIGDYAFYECQYLQSVKIRNNVTSIGTGAFEGCSKLAEIEIPNSVTSIGEVAFHGCSNISAVHISDLQAWCKLVFADDYSNPLSYAKHLFLNDIEITELIVPQGITNIGEYTFRNCIGITSLTLPKSVTNIGEQAFYNSSITTLTVWATTPPEGASNSGINARSCTLYVPAEALETYEDTEWWDFFKEIKPIDGTVNPEPQWDGRCTISYKDKESALLDSEELTFHAPTAPEIEGFTFIKWQASGDSEDGVVMQAVYTANEPTSAPAVVVNPANKAQKLIRQGNVYILSEGKTYSVQGQKVK